MELPTKLRFGFDLFVGLMFVGAAWAALDFQRLARYFPLAIALTGLVLAVANICLDAYRYRVRSTAMAMDALPSAATFDPEIGEDTETARRGLLRAFYYLGWALLYALLIWTLGLVVATVVYLVAFFLIEGREGPVFTMVSVAAVLGMIFLVTDFLNLHWPKSLITHF